MRKSPHRPGGWGFWDAKGVIGLEWEGDGRQVDRWGRIAGLTATEVAAERQCRVQRNSIEDLAHYLEKMSGASIEVVEGHCNLS